jgi:serine/threonine-protein kinase
VTTSRAPVPIVPGSGPPDTEEGRAFLQARLALFGGWIFLISAGFFILFTIVRVSNDVPFTYPMALHAATNIVAGLIWLASRVLRLSAAAARAIDAAGTFVLCTGLTLMAAGLTSPTEQFVAHPMHALMVGILACTYVLIARAIAVPSTPARTAWISALAMAPSAINGPRVLSNYPSDPTAHFGYSDVFAWSVAAVCMSVIASRVIFGLRTEMKKIQRLGQYTLEKKLGQGGMGAVYRARHALLRRPTAVKLLPPETAGEDNIRRFEREVQLTAELTHPSTIAIFDYGRTPEGVFYYAMEYLDGVDLQRLVAVDGPQPAGRVVHILQQVCGALSEAHRVGLIHRDIKPANIILCERGGLPDVAKVVDFGLVKRFEPGAADLTMAETSSHVVLGTPLYLAPEAFAGGWAIDARCDLYAVGAVGYFLLTGAPVFNGNSVVEICAHHLHTPPAPPSRRAPHPVPADLERLILHCLEKKPADRPPDATALQQQLLACTGAAPWPAEQAEQWWRAYRAAHPQSDAKDVPGAIQATAVIDLSARQ